jgi:large subunit ribosomal protein L31
MKPNTHPKYSDFAITIGTDVFMTRSTHPDGKILMDVDYRKHPAWTKEVGNLVNQSNHNISKFNNKFAGLGL